MVCDETSIKYRSWSSFDFQKRMQPSSCVILSPYHISVFLSQPSFYLLLVVVTLGFFTGIGKMALEHVSIGAQHTCHRREKAPGTLAPFNSANASWEVGMFLHLFYRCPGLLIIISGITPSLPFLSLLVIVPRYVLRGKLQVLLVVKLPAVSGKPPIIGFLKQPPYDLFIELYIRHALPLSQTRH